MLWIEGYLVFNCFAVVPGVCLLLVLLCLRLGVCVVSCCFLLVFGFVIWTCDYYFVGIVCVMV